MPLDSTPYELILRAYQVGFGDCFLLTFKYERMHRNVLIDFGSTGKPASAGGGLMLRVANNVREVCAGKLHAIVATHRHKDHISGFATRRGKGPGDVIASCEPEIVIQPWTEDPRAKPDPRRASEQSSRRKSFTAGLRSMHEFSAAMLDELARLRPGLGKGIYNQLAFLGEDNLKNKSAVNNLLKMGKRHLYVRFGSRSGLESLLPGVKTHVLGPPDLEQSEEVLKMRSEHPEEFWHLQSLMGKFISRPAAALFPTSEPYSAPPPQTRWLIHRMQSLRADQLLEIVRALDDVMNNTSVILLFEAGGKRFLFPGDAQWENWSYALSKPEVCKMLETVNLYKVGHHGSLNATPKSLWKLFKNRSAGKSETRLQCVVSTMSGKHGSSSRGTEVPRTTLVEEFKKESEYFTTQDIKGRRIFFKDFTFNLS
jgi:hypothetical protein